MLTKIKNKILKAVSKSPKKDNKAIRTLGPYKDQKGNEIHFSGKANGKFEIHFKGNNNKLYIENADEIEKLTVMFDCSNAICDIKSAYFSGTIRLGEDCEVRIGERVHCNGTSALITSAEGSKVLIGNDCSIAKNVAIRASDSHPIFDVKSGKRVNMCKSIVINHHVWIAANATILGGANIGEGSVIGSGSIVKGKFPNNCTIAGIPARIIRKDIAWERPHLSGVEPPYKPDRNSIPTTPYWNLTQDLEKPEKPEKP